MKMMSNKMVKRNMWGYRDTSVTMTESVICTRLGMLTITARVVGNKEGRSTRSRRGRKTE